MQIRALARLTAAWRDGRARSAVAWRLRRAGHLLASTRYLVRNPCAGRVSLLAPEYVQPNPADRSFVGRIMAAYQRMKVDQPLAAPVYQPSSLWVDQLAEGYRSLLDGGSRGDLDAFHYFLANFGCWRQSTGVESGDVVCRANQNLLTRRQMEVDWFYRQLETWTEYTGGVDAEKLTYPRHGNLAGALLDGRFVGPGSFFNHIHASTVVNLVKDLPRPVVGELGAGYGKLAFFVLRELPRFGYVDFDLPEPLTLAAYYLGKCFPDARMLLYGEAPYSPAAHAAYDLIFMPAWEMERLGESTVDVFLNKNSLGEMSAQAVTHYTALIADATQYFFHLNHDTIRNHYGDGSTSLLGKDYPIPSDRFRLLCRYPDIGHMLYQKSAGAAIDIFCYLYARRHDARATGVPIA